MGLLTANMRMCYLNSQKLDLEYKIQLVSKAKMDLSSQSAELISAGTDVDPNSPVVKQLEARREKLQMLEKKLDQQMLAYQSKLALVETEFKSAQKMFQNNVGSVSY